MTTTIPDRECTLILEGGITSGIVYPALITELARTFRFRHLGGASAGAIGAAFAAAAESARQRGEDGFGRLDGVAAFLTQETHGQLNLQRLFQPQPATQATFETLSEWKRPDRALLGTVRRHPGASVLGALPGAVAALAASRSPAPLLRWTGTVLGLGLGAAGGATAAAISALRDGLDALQGNHYGLCNGMEGTGGLSLALTTWLVQALDDVAALEGHADPLTFGRLAEDGLDLQLITTCLSHGRPYRLPFRPEHDLFYFHEAEFRTLFPARLVDHLLAHPRPVSTDADAQHRRAAYAAQGYHPLPLAPNFPVALAVRMSLSFPVLISTIPLYVVDYSVPAPEGQRRPLEPAVFTDGGLTSNFPLTLFEAALPSRPTFAVNLRGFPREQVRSDDEAKNVWRPQRTADGTLPLYERIDTLGGTGSALLNTMKNWGDALYIRAPGYRDQIIHVSLAPEEGGLNLAMPAPVVRSLIARGRVAAQVMTAASLEQSTWDAHRRARLLSVLAGVDELVRAYAEEFQSVRPGETPWPAVLAAHTPYGMTLPHQQTADTISQALITLAQTLTGTPPLMDAAPKPALHLRLRPEL